MGLGAARHTGGHYDQVQDHTTGTGKQRKTCTLHWGIKRPQVQYQQQKLQLRWSFSCFKTRCAAPYIGQQQQQQQKIRWEGHLENHALGSTQSRVPSHLNSTQWGLVSIPVKPKLSSGQGKLNTTRRARGGSGVCHRQDEIMMIAVRLITSQPQLQTKTPLRRLSSSRSSSLTCMYS